MSSVLRVPSMGPIVGHTTSSSARIWIRGNETDESRTIGIAALYLNKRYVKGSATYFRLKREYDRTGVVDFEKLQPDTRYEVIAGSLSIDTANPNEVLEDEEVFESLPPPESWRGQLDRLDRSEAQATFTTFPAGQVDGLSFVFGSCRYPGVLWLKKRADQIFNCIHQRIHAPDDGTRPRFFMMVGDQIYADVLPKDVGVAVADTEEEFRERYELAFNAPNTRKLLQSVPTYMILDDHEIEDNWVQGRLQQASKRSVFNLAIQSYMSYQWSHGPRSFDRFLYYHFEAGGFPFFVVDGRTQRIRDDEDWDLSDNHLLGQPGKGTGYRGQIDLLCEWLIEQQKTVGDRPKFIVTASVFVPNDVSTAVTDEKKRNRNRCKDDAWAAFPNTRDQLLRTITERRVQNVVFISGDVHCSNVSEISFVDKSKTLSELRAFSVVSSAFYWPYPFANGNPLDFVHDSENENDNFDISNGWQMRYKAWNFQQDDNFSQVDIDWQKRELRVRSFDRKNEQLSATVLKLA